MYLLALLLVALAPSLGAQPAIKPATLVTVDTGVVRLLVAPDGNEARYRVREQLARFSFPNDAVGSTRRVQGQIVLNAGGGVVGEESRFVVDLASLQTDQERRDNFVRRNTLVTDSFPTLVLVPREITGLSNPLPASGERTFQLLTDMTLRGVTRPILWSVTATFGPEGVSGLATTSFSFAEFGIPIPRVAVVMSVEDNIRLEYQFRLVPAGTARS